MTRPSTPDEERAAARALILHEQRHVAAILSRQVVAVPPARRAWCLAPHPDDNLFAVGGCILGLVAQGVPVHGVCLTDGRACVPGRAAREAMARTRQQEETACAAALGITLDWMGVPEDAALEPDGQAPLVARLRASLAEHQPDAVFVPWALENHPVHRLTTALAAHALSEHPEDCTVYSWALTSFPPPAMVVDVTDRFERKLALLEHYPSQTSRHGYAAELRDLATLQARFVGAPVLQAETLLPRPRQQFVTETLALHLDHPDTLNAGAQPMVPE